MSMFNIPVIYYRFEIQIFSYLRLYVIVMEREDIKFYQPVFEHLSTVTGIINLRSTYRPFTGIINLSTIHWDYQPQINLLTTLGLSTYRTYTGIINLRSAYRPYTGIINLSNLHWDYQPQIKLLTLHWDYQPIEPSLGILTLDQHIDSTP